MDINQYIKGNMVNIADYQGNKINDFATGVVEKIGQTNLQSLRECIDDLNQQIKNRIELHNSLLSDMTSQEVEVNNFINQFPTDEGGDVTTLREVITLKAKVIEISQARRAEKLQCWQDIAKLKEELRENTRELNEKQSRMNMLDSILSEE